MISLMALMIVPMAFVLTACGGSNNNGNGDPNGDDDKTLAEQLIGTWVFAHENGLHVVTWIFDENNITEKLSLDNGETIHSTRTETWSIFRPIPSREEYALRFYNWVGTFSYTWEVDSYSDNTLVVSVGVTIRTFTRVS